MTDAAAAADITDTTDMTESKDTMILTTAAADVNAETAGYAVFSAEVMDTDADINPNQLI